MTDDIKLLKSEIKRLRKEISRLAPSLELMLKRRGFSIYKKEPSDDIIVPDRKYMRAFYEKMKKYSFRLFLRDVIKHQNSFTLDKVTKYATKQVSAEYLDFLLEARIAEKTGSAYRLKKRPVKSFGETLEWFVAKLIKNEIQGETIWGIRFKRPEVGGDYDLLARIDTSLLYMEIKSSPPKQVYNREVAAFFDRLEDLVPDIAIFFEDTELRMKDKIVPMFEDELKRRYGKSIAVERLVKELFHINGKIFIINAKDSISANIQTVLTFVFHKEFRIDNISRGN